MDSQHQDRFVDRLSDYLDDEDLGAGERAEIDAHLATCASCRTTLAELRAVVAHARTLPDVPPVADLWTGVAARVQQSTVRPFPRARRFSFTLPQLVAAGLALMVMSGGLVWFARLGDPRTSLPPMVASNERPRESGAETAEPALTAAPARLADPHYDEAIADLEKVLDAGRNRLDPETIRVIEDNLATIDLAIEQARRALRNDPANAYLNNHFAESRHRKLVLLRRATALTMAQPDGGS